MKIMVKLFVKSLPDSPETVHDFNPYASLDEVMGRVREYMLESYSARLVSDEVTLYFFKHGDSFGPHRILGGPRPLYRQWGKEWEKVKHLKNNVRVESRWVPAEHLFTHTVFYREKPVQTTTTLIISEAENEHDRLVEGLRPATKETLDAVFGAAVQANKSFPEER